MKKILFVLPLLFVTLVLSSCQRNVDYKDFKEATPTETFKTDTITNEEVENENMKIINTLLKTDKGDIKIELTKNTAPNSVENFVAKSKSGYYEGLTFHRVEDWVVQGGDPVGNGTGGGNIKTELSQSVFAEGSVGIARGGDIAISNDSQFFICIKDCSWLTGQYTYLGKVTEGMDIAKTIAVGDKINKIEVVE